MNLIRFLFLFFIFSFVLQADLTPDEEKKYDETEGIKFLEQLVHDQKFQEALDLFKKYNPSQKNQTSYNLLIAKSYYHLKQYPLAKLSLDKITSDFSSEYYLTRGLVSFELKNYEDCAALLKRTLTKGLETYLQCLNLSHKDQNIYQTLTSMTLTCENDHVLKIKYLVSLNLYEEAKKSINTFTSTCPSANLFLEVLDLSHKNKISIPNIFEQLHYCHPDKMETNAPFIKDLFDNSYKYSLQLQFQKLSLEDTIYYQHSSEFLKKAGYTEATYFQHLLNPDLKSYQQFKLQKTLEADQLIRTASINVDNNENAYALAYAHFLTNNAQKSFEILNRKEKRSEQENRLWELSQLCLKEGWRCRP